MVGETGENQHKDRRTHVLFFVFLKDFFSTVLQSSGSRLLQDENVKSKKSVAERR